MVIVHGTPLTVEEEGRLNAMILNQHMEIHNECAECKRYGRRQNCSNCINNGVENDLLEIIRKFGLEEWI